MEYDNEIQAGKNSYTTQFRQYDPRLGRWKSLDPLMSSFPSVSPYEAFGNNPIVFTDPYGLAPTNGDDDNVIVKGENDAPDDRRIYKSDGRWRRWKKGDEYHGTDGSRHEYGGKGKWEKTTYQELEEVDIVFNRDGKKPAEYSDGVFAKNVLIKGLSNYAPKKQNLSSNAMQWERDLAEYNFKTATARWNNMTWSEQFEVARRREISKPIQQVSKEMAEPVAELFKLQAKAGGSGMATGAGSTIATKVVDVVTDISNPVSNGVRVGSAAYKSKNASDVQHYFNDIVENYAMQGTKTLVPGGDDVIRTMYQIHGAGLDKSGKMVSGIYEWLMEGTNVTHRRFIPGGVYSKTPNQIVK